VTFEPVEETKIMTSNKTIAEGRKPPVFVQLETVPFIRAMYTRGDSYEEIAKRFNVPLSGIARCLQMQSFHDVGQASRVQLEAWEARLAETGAVLSTYPTPNGLAVKFKVRAYELWLKGLDRGDPAMDLIGDLITALEERG
jgi:hypothetical protein